MFAIDTCTTITDRSSAPLRRAPRRSTARKVEGVNDLLARAILGDIDAAAEFKDRYLASAIATAHDLVDDDNEAEIIADAAFDRLFGGWPPERGSIPHVLTRAVRRAARARSRALFGAEA